MKNAIKAALHIPLTKPEILTEQEKRNAELARKMTNALLLRQDHVEEQDYRWAEHKTFKDNMEDNSENTSLQLYNLKRYAELADERIREDDELIARLDARKELGRIAFDIAHSDVLIETLGTNFEGCVPLAHALMKQIDATTQGYADNARLIQNFGGDIITGLSRVRLMLEGLILAISAELNPAPPPKPPFSHRAVKFIKSTNAEGKFASLPIYAKGETATFEYAIASSLVASGVAEWV